MKNGKESAAGAIRPLLRDIPDFPRKGIVFKDITPLLQNPKAFSAAVDAVVGHFSKERIDCVCAIESRGFLFGAPIALKIGVPFAPLRKKGKLPAKTLSVAYALEYGEDAIEIHADAFAKGARVLIVDDLLATGGSMSAACALVKKLGGQIAGCAFVVELTFLKGRERLKDYEIFSIVDY